jgi:choline transport protein
LQRSHFADHLSSLKVNPRFHVPANAIVATAIFVCIVSLINIGSTVAFNAVLSLASNAVCWSKSRRLSRREAC